MISSSFPLEFPDIEIYGEQLERLHDFPFLVCGMLTPSHASYADRLMQSCAQFNLPHVLYRVPTVHLSTSPKGSGDLRFTKANFVHFLLERYEKPILYLDADCYFADYPRQIEILVQDGYDFGIYNWLADEHTDAYRPIDVKVDDASGSRIIKKRFYVFSHSVDYYATDQLICSGAVQFYGNTAGARMLLRAWHNVVANFPNSADDECMTFAYNNLVERSMNLRVKWLDKAYARCAWWIYVRPVIDHPDFPDLGQAFLPIPESQGRKCFYPERAQLPRVNPIFPRGYVIDTKEKMLLRPSGGGLVPIGKFEHEIWA